MSFTSRFGISLWLIVFLAIEGLFLYNDKATLAVTLALIVSAIWIWLKVATALKIPLWISVGIPLIVFLLLNAGNQVFYR